jgi:hypothetical protein
MCVKRIYSLMLPQHIYSIVCHVQQIPLYSNVIAGTLDKPILLSKFFSQLNAAILLHLSILKGY